MGRFRSNTIYLHKYSKKTWSRRRGPPWGAAASVLCMGVHGRILRRRRRGPPWGAAASGLEFGRNEQVFIWEW